MPFSCLSRYCGRTAGPGGNLKERCTRALRWNAPKQSKYISASICRSSALTSEMSDVQGAGKSRLADFAAEFRTRFVRRWDAETSLYESETMAV